MTPYGSSVTISPGSAAPPALLDRMTAPEDPGGYGNAQSGALSYAAYVLGYPDLWGEYRTNADSALTYSAFWACVRVIVSSFVSISWRTYERGADDRSKTPIEDDVSWLLSMQANPEMSALDWRGTMVKDALVGGNGYAEIERLNNGKPAWLWRLDPDRVEPVRDDAGQLYYKVDNGTGERASYLRPEDVFHLKGMGPDGIVGWSVVRLFRTAIKLGLSEERFGEQFFQRGPMPGGFVTVPGNMNTEKRAEFRRSFEQVYTGAKNQHRIVVLSNGVTFDPAELPNDDAQFLESRLFQVGEMCRIFGIPPQKLADLAHTNFSIAEEMEIAYVRDCVLPWASRLECEANLKLYGRTNRGKRFTKLNLDALLRGNSITQTEVIARQVQSGLRDVNEARAYFDLNPRDEGDKLLVQGAMTTLERVIAGESKAVANPASPDPGADGEPMPPPPPDKGAANPEDLRRVFGGLLADVYARLYRVSGEKAKRAANKGRLREHVEEWHGRSGVDSAFAELFPTLEALCLAGGMPSDEAVGMAEAAAAAYVERCRRDLLERGVSAAVADWENGRPRQDADNDLSRVLR